jgi:RHS repeat-associated protein
MRSFEVIRESVVYGNGSFSVNGSLGAAVPNTGTGGLSRYRYVEEEGGVSGNRNGGDANLGERRYVGINATLYAKGEAVGMNRLNIDDYSGGTGYLGKDILGSVRGITNEYGVMEGRYEYDAFGNPYRGEMNNGVGLGYTGKPYDVITGMYNYGYRDYKPEAARFTTEDPVRDGANWFAYVNNDPVNWVDLWGLSAQEPDRDNTPIIENTVGITITAPRIESPVFPTDSTRITSTFGGNHPLGIDVGATSQGVAGDVVRAAMGGTVITAGSPDWSPSGSSYVIIEGNDGRTYRYTHTDNMLVTAGDTVTTGQQVSSMSDVGADAVHLHFEVFENGQRIDPLSLFPDTTFTLPGGQ